MKILHIQAQLPSKTGSGVYFTNIINKLKSKAEQVSLYGCYPGFKWDVLPEEKQYQVVFPNEKSDFPLPGMSDVMPYESTIYSKMNTEMIENWKASFKPVVHQAVADFNPDVIISHHLWFLTDLLQQWFPDKKIVAISHGSDLRQASQHPKLVARYASNIKDLNYICALSQDHVDAIKKLYGASDDQIIVLGSGFDSKIFYPTEKDKNKPISLVYAGKIAASKGVFELVDTFKDQLKNKGNIRLELYGAGDEKATEHLNQLINEDKRITYHGAVNQSVLGDVFRKHEIFVLPSYYEGLPLVVLESLACGMHVVVNEFPALINYLSDTINNSGWITYVKQPPLENIDRPIKNEIPAYRDRLALALLKQIDHASYRNELPEELNTTVKQFSWSGLVERLWKIIQ